MSEIYATFVEACRLREQALADGATRDQADALVVNALKAAWPQGREQPWRFVCRTCEDTGWEWFVCGEQGLRCGRPFKLPDQKPDDWTGRGTCRGGHSAVRPCPSCSKGDARRRSILRQPKSADDELAAVGKMKPPTRFGGR